MLSIAFLGVGCADQRNSGCGPRPRGKLVRAGAEGKARALPHEIADVAS